jgi:hypothetical protein
MGSGATASAHRHRAHGVAGMLRDGVDEAHRPAATTPRPAAARDRAARRTRVRARRRLGRAAFIGHDAGLLRRVRQGWRRRPAMVAMATDGRAQMSPARVDSWAGADLGRAFGLGPVR